MVIGDYLLRKISISFKQIFMLYTWKRNELKIINVIAYERLKELVNTRKMRIF